MIESLKVYGPGVALCAAVSAVATLVEKIEVYFAGQSYLEALVIAILLGVLVRTFWAPGPVWRAGISFQRQDAARDRDRAARRLAQRRHRLGARTDPAVRHRTIVVGRDREQLRDLPRARACRRACRMLVACGNSICGNSAIAAVAPIIGAKPDDVASSIAFTAVLGVVVVLGLAAAGADPRSVADAIRRARGADRLRGAAGSRRDACRSAS